VNLSAPVISVVPAGVVMLVSTAPGPALGGETAVTCVSELTVKLEAETEPNLTPVAPVKSWPLITTEVPPLIEPVGELTPVMPGGG